MIDQGFTIDHLWYFGFLQDFHHPFTPLDRLNTSLTAGVSKAQSHGPFFSCCGTESIDCSVM